jgi:hypothetical protein
VITDGSIWDLGTDVTVNATTLWAGSAALDSHTLTLVHRTPGTLQIAGTGTPLVLETPNSFTAFCCVRIIP